MRSASSASQMSPLPSTGTSSACLSGGDGLPVGLARVALGGGARVQRDPLHAGVLGDQAGLDVGQVVVVDALAHLDGDRDAGRGGGVHGRGLTIAPNSRRFHGIAEPPPLLVIFRTLQPKFRSMWSARFSSTIRRTARAVISGSTP